MPGYTFLVLSLSTDPILAPLRPRFLKTIFRFTFTYIHVISRVRWVRGERLGSDNLINRPGKEATKRCVWLYIRQAIPQYPHTGKRNDSPYELSVAQDLISR